LTSLKARRGGRARNVANKGDRNDRLMRSRDRVEVCAMIGGRVGHVRVVGWSGTLLPAIVTCFCAGCVQVGVTSETSVAQGRAKVFDVELEQCIDRTGTPGRDLGAEATEAFTKELRKGTEFVAAAGARYRVACEVTSFVEGSAFKRWLLPGWGATVGQVTAMLTDTRTGEVLIIARGNATVAAGGLYTIGADTYIVPSAVDQVMSQLREWARAGAPASGSGPTQRGGGG